MTEHIDLTEIVRTAHDWRMRLSSLGTTQADRDAFDAWLAADPRHEQAYARAETLWDGLGELTHNDFSSALYESSTGEKVRSLRSFTMGVFASPFAWASGVAVAAAIALVGPILSNVSAPTSADQIITTRLFETNLGEIQSFQMEDGTMITLGAASEIRMEYSETIRSANLLKGDIFFQVSSDPSRPFTVIANDMKVQVTGTSFDVKKQDSLIRVAVAEGSVRVRYPLVVDGTISSLNQQSDLTSGQIISAKPTEGLSDVVQIDPILIGAWREDRLIYDGDPLAVLVSDLNRYSTTPVRIEETENEVSRLRIRGAFSGREIDEILSTLPLIHPLEIDRSDPDQIIIRSTTR
ncbi:MAG: FecR domain-containing protein [Pseudomonadota bacterium]